MSDDLDTLIRTVYGEAGGEPLTGQQAVAAVALNRSRATGQPVSSVVTAPGQFESWNTPSARKRMLALDPNSPTYQSIKAAITPIVDGSAPDPTGGADHFYAPTLQAADGRKKPAWDNGTGQPIGNHLFFKLGNGAVATTNGIDPAFSGRSTPAGGATDLDAAFSGNAGGLDPSFTGRSGNATPAPAVDLDKVFSGAPVNVASSSAIQDGVNKIVRAGGNKDDVLAFLVAHNMDPNQTKIDDATINWSRSTGKPITVYQPGEAPPQTGTNPATAAPSISLTPLKPSDSNVENAGQGFRHAFENIGETGAKLSSWVDSHIPALAALDKATGADPTGDIRRYDIDRKVYDQTAGKTWAGATGNVAGSLLATAPLMGVGGKVLGAGGEALANALPETQGAVDFLAGNAGRAVPANALTGAAAVPGNLLLRGASLATNGAVQGGTAAGLLSGGSDVPVGRQIATGALGGAVLAPAIGAAGTVANKLKFLAAPVTGPINRLTEIGADPANLAADRIASRMAQDANAGGPTLADMQAAAAAAPGKPLTLMDVGGENIRGLAGRVARAPGESRAIIANTLAGRDQGAGARVSQDIRDAISAGGSSHDTTQALMQQRSTAAAPLYEQAFQGGSVAPLEHQFQQAFANSSGDVANAEKALRDAQNAATQSKAGVSRAGDNVYGANSALRTDSSATANVTTAERNLAAAQATHQANLDRLRQAQADGSANAPGAVWSPRIQQFLDDPIMKGGLQRGLAIQRIESVAGGKPFNPSEYAITGIDETGNPTVGAVPNMRLLDAGKKGLDAIIADNTDAVTGKVNEYGRAVTQFKKAYVDQLDGINPDYKDARAAFSGPSSSMAALNRGRQILNQRPEANRDFLTNLSAGDKEFFKQGAADALLEKIARTSAGGDETKRIIGNDYVQQQLRPLFSSQGAFDKFIGNIQAEAQMYATRQAVLGGSQTGGRVAEDGSPSAQAALKAGRAVASGAVGHWGGVLHNTLEAMGHLAERRDPATNAAVAHLLTTPLTPGSVSSNMLLRAASGEEPAVVMPALSRYAQQQGAPYVANRLLPILNDNYAAMAAASDARRKKQDQPGR